MQSFFGGICRCIEKHFFVVGIDWYEEEEDLSNLHQLLRRRKQDNLQVPDSLSLGTTHNGKGGVSTEDGRY